MVTLDASSGPRRQRTCRLSPTPNVKVRTDTSCDSIGLKGSHTGGTWAHDTSFFWPGAKFFPLRPGADTSQDLSFVAVGHQHFARV